MTSSLRYHNYVSYVVRPEMHCVIETPAFARAADTVLIEEERLAITTAIAENPTMGVVIKGTGGARKVRFPGRGKGKSGGYRVVTFFAAEDVPVFLLDVFGKGDKVNLSKAECNALRKILGGLAEEWRKSVKMKAAMLERSR